MKKVGAFFVFAEKSLVPNGCQGGVGIVFGSYPGAVSYVVQYHDSNVAAPHIAGGPVTLNELVSARSPNGYHLDTNEGTQVDTNPVIPSGAHFFGVTGFSGSGSCGTVTVDDTQGGRFSDPEAWAVLSANYKPPKQKASISVAIMPGLSGTRLAVGKTVDVSVKVTAGPVALSSVSLGRGLILSSDAATLVSGPSELGGLSLAAGASHLFHFAIKGDKDGPETLLASASGIASATGGSSQGGVRGSARSTLNVGEVLGIDWTMPPRLTDAEAASWSDTPDGVAPSSYVYPKDGWQVNLFVTSAGQPDCPAGETFKWTVSGGGKTVTLPGESCRESAHVPKLGVYSVSAKVYKDGAATGETVQNQRVVVRDWLIVGLGDSNGSGQGNPPYLDKQCDRGVTSYQYQVAKYIEDNDPRSSVTFLFAACSGARSNQLWQTGYAGQEASQGINLPPQIVQVRERIDAVAPQRHLDAAIMSVGINDLQFGSIMEFCTSNRFNCNALHVTVTTSPGGDVTYTKTSNPAASTLAADVADRLGALPKAFDALAPELKTLSPGHVFITQYPDETTSASGARCTGTEGPLFPRFLTSVWQWLHEVGSGLNAAVGKTSPLGWVPIGDIAERFSGHGYCSTDSYFQAIFSRSNAEQWNFYGSFHADSQGQNISFEETRTKVCNALYGNPTCSGIPPAPN